jgi:hypothetical protein
MALPIMYIHVSKFIPLESTKEPLMEVNALCPVPEAINLPECTNEFSHSGLKKLLIPYGGLEISKVSSSYAARSRSRLGENPSRQEKNKKKEKGLNARGV